MGTPNFARSCLASSTPRAPCVRAAVPGAQIQIGGDAVCPDTLSRESQACDPSICLQHVQHSTAQAHRHISDIPEAGLTTRRRVHNFSPQQCSCALANASATRIVECCNRDHMYWCQEVGGAAPSSCAQAPCPTVIGPRLPDTSVPAVGRSLFGTRDLASGTCAAKAGVHQQGQQQKLRRF